MSELISGKEALIELSKDNVVQYYDDNLNEWVEMDMKLHHSRKFRIKPRTIAINGIEVPKNSKKHDKDQVVWVVNTSCENWYDWIYGSDCDSTTLYWETEEEIKQVVNALRSIFK